MRQVDFCEVVLLRYVCTAAWDEIFVEELRKRQKGECLLERYWDDAHPYTRQRAPDGGLGLPLAFPNIFTPQNQDITVHHAELNQQNISKRAWTWAPEDSPLAGQCTWQVCSDALMRAGAVSSPPGWLASTVIFFFFSGHLLGESGAPEPRTVELPKRMNADS